MAIIQNDGKRERRRPSLKGGVMLDVVNGSERARAWPKKRGKKLHPKTVEQNEWFRQAQWATKFMAPEMYWQIAAAVQGTPLLPRDILTMMLAGRLAAFTLPSGRTIWSKQVSNDVTTALDVICDIPGALLVRGETQWQAILPGADGLILTSKGPGQLPEWDANGGGGGAEPAIIGWPYPGTASDVLTAGYVSALNVAVAPQQTISKVGFWAETASPTTQWHGAVYANNAGNPGALITEATAIKTGIVAGMNFCDLDIPFFNNSPDATTVFIATVHTIANFTIKKTSLWQVRYWNNGSLVFPANAPGASAVNNGWQMLAIP